MEISPVLIIDDDASITNLIEKILASQNIPCLGVGSIAEANQALAETPLFSVLLCDHLLPDGMGVDFLRDIRQTYPHAVRVLMTGLYDKNLALQAINSGEIYRFLLKPFNVDDLLVTVNQSIDRYQLLMENVRLQNRLEQQNQALKNANIELSSLLTAEELKARGFQQQTSSWKEASQGMIDLCLEIIQRTDPHLHRHSQRVMTLSMSIARSMNCEEEFIERIGIAGQLHDIGLLGCQITLRDQQRKPEMVADYMEREQLKMHPQISAQLVKFLPLPDVIEAIQHHHEYINGSGYPHSLQGDRISKMGQILGAADYYDEVGRTSSAVLFNMQTSAGTLFKPEIIRALDGVINSGLHIPKEKPATLPELLPGMRLASSIYTASGMLLVKKGQVLSMSIIQRLQQHSQSHAITQNIFVEI